MKIRSVLKYTALIFLTLILIISINRIFFSNTESIVFQVSIPAHTPDLDAIILHIEANQYLMTRETDTMYTFELKPENWPDQEGAFVGYGYSRGGFLPFAEYGLYNFDYFRSFEVKGGKVIEDTIERWKWFPTEPLDEELIQTSAETFTIAPREEYWKGILFADFWNDEWELQYDATIAHLHEQGYNWIGLAPPWDFLTTDPPVLSDQNVQVPAYPEGKLRNHIRVFKEAGFKVHLSPQVCCEMVDTTSKDVTWWNAWYEELKKYYQFHIAIAIEEEVDAFEIGPSLFGADLPLSTDLPSEINGSEKWDEILTIVKSAGIPVGFGLSTFSALWDIQAPWLATEVTFYDDLDYIGISLWSELVDFDNPTQSDYNFAMERVFSQVDIIQNQTDLPVVFTQVSYPSHSGAGFEVVPESDLLYRDPDLAPFEYNPFEQAMIYEAFMRGIANRSYVQGSFAFGYWYVDAPLAVDDPSIRGKMAEIIYTKWLERLSPSQMLQITSGTMLDPTDKSSISLDKFNLRILPTKESNFRCLREIP